MTARRVLVTGAGGFIGSHLVEALVARGDTVRAMVRYNARGDLGHLADIAPAARGAVEVVSGDITDPVFTRASARGCEVVFHLAALIAIPYSYRAPYQVFGTNCVGTVNVAQACLDEGVDRMIHTSTSEVYGTAQTVPISESHPLVGQSPYAASKIAADQAVESFRRAFGLRAVTVRPFNTYGPRQSARAVLPTIVTQALARGSIKLGSLTPTRDLNFVADTARGFVLAAEVDDALGRTLNLATGKEVSIGDLAARVLRALGKDLPVESDDRRVRPAQSEVERLCGDASLARAVLGWAPTVSLDEGVARVIDYVRANPGRYRPDEYAT
ncbi:MAG: SDR family NAD(P)-dependent oxidoreductase [Polyangiales bacterium]